MQSASMDVDSSAGPSTKQRGRGFASGRGGAAGALFAKARAAPYSRPTPVPSGQWQHDKSELFAPGSNLYTPQLAAAPVDSSSPSLRPFGAATPALPGAVNGAASAKAPARQAAPPSAPKADLFQRLGIKGSSAAGEAQEKQRREEERRSRIEQQRQDKLKADAARKAAEERRRAEARREIQVKISQQEEMGFVVQVEGLVYGTSAEDVQTAFSAYGETSFCFVVNEETATDADDLIARLTFKLHDDAVTACSKLNGAIADGKPLKVQQVPRTPMPPPVANVLGAAPASARRGAVPNGPRAQKQAAVVVAPPTRKMYADEVEAVDPRLSNVIDITGDDVDMDVEEQISIPTGPRRYGAGPGARGGRGGSRAAFSHQQQQKAAPAPAAAPSLLARLGGAPAAAAGGRGGRGAGGKGAPRGGAGSLLARLG